MKTKLNLRLGAGKRGKVIKTIVRKMTKLDSKAVSAIKYHTNQLVDHSQDQIKFGNDEKLRTKKICTFLEKAHFPMSAIH